MNTFLKKTLLISAFSLTYLNMLPTASFASDMDTLIGSGCCGSPRNTSNHKEALESLRQSTYTKSDSLTDTLEDETASPTPQIAATLSAVESQPEAAVVPKKKTKTVTNYIGYIFPWGTKEVEIDDNELNDSSATSTATTAMTVPKESVEPTTTAITTPLEDNSKDTTSLPFETPNTSLTPIVSHSSDANDKVQLKSEEVDNHKSDINSTEVQTITQHSDNESDTKSLHTHI